MKGFKCCYRLILSMKVNALRPWCARPAASPLVFSCVINLYFNQCVETVSLVGAVCVCTAHVDIAVSKVYRTLKCTGRAGHLKDSC